ncbi:Undecaprenyl-phosphate glucose phosphotransferase [Tistlia consotensis]|uniref:Undecaprenyl-phosphate glucose phosphotransferase n=1 Tax=Tistlia consotensis USBA 355 TaxID=560819 RepID=A0A1Y6CE26_9PROT|nr:undecaprenyl-phosphate glucose phosphotransferase [Tistlia consotensis]SMF59099.1 Undecaprenyl-phosphate glucose phosphotransferase [Tistlia consotensis USBA 355]SNR64102.1 Undecaprenyl-phosphate glucose phosphotransferase [Tistlia consotensis]
MSETIWAGTEERGAERARPASPALTPSVLPSLLSVGLAGLDALVIAGASYLAYLIWLQTDPYAEWQPYAVATLLGTVLTLNAFGWLRLYDLKLLARLGPSLLRLLGGCGAVAGAILALSYFSKTSGDYSRAWAGLWFVIAVAGLVVLRASLVALARRGRLDDALSRRVVIVGEAAHAEQLIRQLELDSKRLVRVVRIFSGGPDTLDLDGLERCLCESEVDTVVMAIPWVEEDWALDTFARLYQYPVEVLLCPRGIGLSLTRPRVRYLGEVPMFTLADRPLSGWRYLAKAVEDRMLASLILLLIAPLLAIIAVLIKLDSPGPVLFRQKRYGFNNRLIEVWKFRTMHHAMTDHNAEQLTQRNDPRITRLGRVLRAYSLDELPQFLNVLRGDMSIVGPRPHAVSAKAGGLLYQQAVRQYAARHRVKPGITGWAQINGWRGETETVKQIRRRVQHDIAYIEDWSLWLDLKIIFMTIFVGFSGKNAF